MISKPEIVDNFKGCIHCSQIVAQEMANTLGVDKEMLMSATAGLGGGGFHGDTCGCVTSSLICLGLATGHCHKGDAEANGRLVEKCAEFEQRFMEKHGSLLCRDLVGYDFGVPEEAAKIAETGVTLEKCPAYVQTALEILDDLI